MYSPITPKAIRIAPEKTVTATNIEAKPDGTVLSTILSTKNINAKIKPIEERIIPINIDSLRGKIEKLVAIFDQSFNILVIV